MQITSTGTSSLQALYLQSLLGASSGTDTQDQDTTSLYGLLASGQDTLSISSQAQWMSRNQDGNPMKADLDNLGDLISSGDMTGARKAYAAMQERMQGRPAGGGQDPLATEFEALGKALDSGDATAASTALESLQSKAEKMGPPPAGAPPRGGGPQESGDTATATSLQALMLSAYASTSAWWTASSGQSGS